MFRPLQICYVTYIDFDVHLSVNSVTKFLAYSRYMFDDQAKGIIGFSLLCNTYFNYTMYLNNQAQFVIATK